MKEAYYFSHDSNASQDEKILNLRADHGWEGYGIFWAVIERLRDSTDHKYRIDSIKGLAVSLGIKRIVLEEIINNYDLFESNEDFFWSTSLNKRMEEKEKKRKQAVDAVNKRWKVQDNKNDTDVIRENYDSNTQVENQYNDNDTDVIQGKERKGKEKKGKENILDTHTIARAKKIEILEIFEKKGLNLEDGEAEFEKFLAFFDERDWKNSGGAPIRDPVNVAKTWTIKQNHQQKSNGNNGGSGKISNIYGTGRAPRNSAAVIAEADEIIERAFNKR
jgi:hypothetical protein